MTFAASMSDATEPIESSATTEVTSQPEENDSEDSDSDSPTASTLTETSPRAREAPLTRSLGNVRLQLQPEPASLAPAVVASTSGPLSPHSLLTRSIANVRLPRVVSDTASRVSAFHGEAALAGSASAPAMPRLRSPHLPVLQRSPANMRLQRLDCSVVATGVDAHSDPVAESVVPLKASLRRSLRVPESGGFLCGTVTPTGMWLGTAVGLVFRLDQQGGVVDSFAAHSGRIYGVVPAWPNVWTAGEDGAVHLWDGQAQPAPRRILTLIAHGKVPIRAMACVFAPNEGYMMCTGDASGLVCVWPMAASEGVEPIARLQVPNKEPLQSIAQMNDAMWVGGGRNIYVYDLTVLPVSWQGPQTYFIVCRLCNYGRP